jgi:hypothetical protein
MFRGSVRKCEKAPAGEEKRNQWHSEFGAVDILVEER